MEVQQKSEFNDAIGLLGRCDYIFRGLIDSKQYHDAFNWYMLLVNLLMELSADIPQEEFDKIFKEIEGCADKVNRWQRNCDSGVRNIESDLFIMLINIEKELKDIHARCGYRNKMMEDASKALR